LRRDREVGLLDKLLGLGWLALSAFGSWLWVDYFFFDQLGTLE
jgi:hypothetical protein